MPSSAQSTHPHLGARRRRPRPFAMVIAALVAFVASAPAWPPTAALALPSDHPASYISSPAPGGRLFVGEPASISGGAWNGEAGGIVGVEISLDGGATWQAADLANESWSYSFVPTEPGKILIVSRASTVDVTEVPVSAVAAVVEPDDVFDAHACPCALWFNATDFVMAADPDQQAVELGVRFSADINGFVTGIRFAKPVENTGSHVGRLWGTDGALLAEVAFTDETAEGWQEATFDQPVAVTANTTYIASYYTPTGNYVSTEDYFSSGRDFFSRPLRTAHLSTPGQPYTGAGVYRYGVGGGFPDQTWHDSNYWVSPVFTAS
ncbi:hypothetical protein DMB66_50150 [Actinoplanes sp. ATCC 53533]|uniref:DUF4082 domain-containing protein n=1 Tax=Actinoplanes sp. ATCC 53533 TaxID=1288362 RepID=UPI000F78E3F4|nr:DUF4082 domain-containing protein [Actinoplanes sp. ATCC 53533]RSM46146.1 hypothetical protein DMB66_50150 [Actinoplanes sp. ATCC 53533]